MKRDKNAIRSALLKYFQDKKTAAEAHRLLSEDYGEKAPSESTCRQWFRRFQCGDFNVEDKKRAGQPKKFEDAKLLELMDANPELKLEDLAKQLNVTASAISKRLLSIKRMKKKL